MGLEKDRKCGHFKMAEQACMVCTNGPSIFLLRRKEVKFLRRILNDTEWSGCCVHKYANGYRVYFADYITWTLSHLILEDRGIFHLKF